MKHLIFISVTLFSLSACNQAELDKSTLAKDSLLIIVKDRDVAINEFISSFNEVENNLDSVALRQNIISMDTRTNHDLKTNKKNHINAEIFSINKLMLENNEKIEELNHKLKNSKLKNIQLEKIVATLDKQIITKYYELTALNEKLNALNGEVEKLHTSIDTLLLQNSMKTQTITSKTTELHTAYYVVGKSKDLQNAKLIDKKGGLLGIGSTTKLNSNLDHDKFTSIDFTQITRIAINSLYAKIVSTHPADSYTLERNKKIITNLLITSPEKFWSISKYLVIVKE